MNLFDDDLYGGGNYPLIAKMMAKTKAYHGSYRKPPKGGFTYDTKEPEGWSEHIQKHLGEDGVEPVKYKRPPPRVKTEEEQEYDRVHKFEYWGLDKSKMEYSEEQQRWYDPESGYAFPPIHFKDHDGKMFWGIPHYAEKPSKGQHYDSLAFHLDDAGKIKVPANWTSTPRNTKMRNGRYPPGAEREEVEMGEDQEGNTITLERIEAVRSQNRNLLTSKHPRYFWWYHEEDSEYYDGHKFYGGDKPVMVEPEATAETEEQKEVALKQLATAMKLLAKRIGIVGDYNDKRRIEKERLEATLERGEEILEQREANQKRRGLLDERVRRRGTARDPKDIKFRVETGFAYRNRYVEPGSTFSLPFGTSEREAKEVVGATNAKAFIRAKEANIDKREKARRPSFPKDAGSGGISKEQLEARINKKDDQMTYSAKYVEFMLEVLAKNEDVVEEIDPDDPLVMMYRTIETKKGTYR